jgi:hypothetical protein
VLLNVDQTPEFSVAAFNGPASAVFAQVDKAPVAPNGRMPVNTRFWTNLYATALRGAVTPGTYETRRAFLSVTEATTTQSAGFAPYDQFEVSIPFEIAGDCLMEVGAEVYSRAALWDGFRSPALVRFVTGEEFYLSNTNGKFEISE